ncbi:MAG: aminoacyl-tRNA hydrolase [bacterium (Candidatus Ratteibacteria) CG_4_10_14_3_um_filter_41_18]|uniref:Peptidyl-tRNA hydrolase n=3 Tax=Candidatus Ratteibacteria TaxID=2979319 RepID=A0A2M7YHN2_9BACT|nr:MAG: aminoacyl-tRNA hydrolase [bacterium (Candidatus Ratteibacteria) CG_4_10_14_3_um_filter_41_18]PJA62478.1 MAG: aminoacyl-tRNA hydrolase [bacterium (Candidatus Ratteibacteria) CG_4_9_14_3_um_filter_41_21]
MWLIIGLGNPGRRYHSTRHNAGFLAIDYLASKNHLSFRRSLRYKSEIGQGRIKEKEVILLKPLAFMNNSGIPVRTFLKKHRIKKEEILILCDDLSLPLGKIRLRAKGSAGGHNGLESIIACLGTNDFSRLRIGIGFPEEDKLTDYVLSSFKKEENKELKKVLEAVVDAVESLLETGTEKTMSKFN